MPSTSKRAEGRRYHHDSAVLTVRRQGAVVNRRSARTLSSRLVQHRQKREAHTPLGPNALRA